MKDYLIIIPAYNEEKNIGRVLDGMRHFRENTIIINDGSADHTSQIIKEKGFFCINNYCNHGVADCIIQGINLASERQIEKVIIMDADGQHNPAKIPGFLEELENHDFVFGCRYHKSELIPTNKWASNLFAAALYAELTGLFLTDISCGFKGISLSDGLVDVLKKSQGFEAIYDIVSYAMCNRKSISVVPIEAVYYYDELLCTRNKEIIALLNSIENCKKIYHKNYAGRFARVIQDIKQAVLNNRRFGINIADTNFWAFPVANDSYFFQINPVDIEKWIKSSAYLGEEIYVH